MAKSPRSFAPRHRRAKLSSDPTRAEATYPVGDYHKSASDPVGRSMQIRVTCPPQYGRIAATLVAHGHFGFQTPEDAYRWCLYNGLEQLAKRAEDHEVTKTTKTLKSWAMGRQQALEDAYFTKILVETEKDLNKIARTGNPWGALELARRILSELDGIEHPKIRKRFRSLATSIVVKLRKFSEDDE